jgi:hypothetical protein
VSDRSNALAPISEDMVLLTPAAGAAPAAGAIVERLGDGARGETWLMAASSGEPANAGADAVAALRGALSSRAADVDTATALKQAFRATNDALWAAGAGETAVAAVALYADGKYATIASAGNGRAYLLRAGRLNQITRDAADGGKPGKAATPVGAREKLDTRQPGIYEIVLLPEDRLLLATPGVMAATSDDTITAMLQASAASAAGALSTGGGALAVAVEVAPAKVRTPVPVAAGGGFPTVLVAILVLLIVAAAVAYTLLIGF